MMSELRERKLRHVFELFIDTDKNGVWDRNDFEMLLQRLLTYKELNQEQQKKLREDWTKMFEEMLKYLNIKEDYIDYKNWIRMWDNYAKDPTNAYCCDLYEEHVFQYYYDPVENGVTNESQTPILKFFGVSEEIAKLSFEKAAQNKRVLDRQTYSILWREYFTSDDPNAPGGFLYGFVNTE